MSGTPVQAISLSQIKLDKSLWPRESLDRERVEFFAELIADAAGEAARAGKGWTDPLPPIVVVADGQGGYVLADGWHRVEARRILGAGFDVISAEVHLPDSRPTSECVYWLALLHATRTARPLSTAEKRAAIERLLTERPDLSDRAIARLVGVSHATVGAHRARLVNLTTGADGASVGGATAGGPQADGESAWERAARRLAVDVGDLMASCRKIFGGPDYKTAGHELYEALAERFGDEEAVAAIEELAGVVEAAQARMRKLAASHR
jgi:hypothetical protein